MSKRYGILGGVVLTITLALLSVAFFGARPAPNAGASSGIQTCLNLTVPSNTEVGTFLDRTAQTLELSWFDETLQTDKSVTIKYLDPTCQTNAQTKGWIDHALDVDLEWMTETCQSLDRISKGQEAPPTRNGVTLSTLAIPAFMTAHCNSSMFAVN